MFFLHYKILVLNGNKMKINALEQEQQNTIINNYMVNPLSNKKFYFIGDVFCNKTFTRNTKNWMEYLKDFLELSDDQVLMKYENNVSFYKEYLPSTAYYGNLPYSVSDKTIYSPLDLINQLKASNPDFIPTDIFICIGALDLWAAEAYYNGNRLEEEEYKTIEEMINKGITDVIENSDLSKCNIWIGWIPVINYFESNSSSTKPNFISAYKCKKYADILFNNKSPRAHYLNGVELCLLYKYEDTYNPQSITWEEDEALYNDGIDSKGIFGLPREEGSKILAIGIESAFLHGKFNFSYCSEENKEIKKYFPKNGIYNFCGGNSILCMNDYMTLYGGGNCNISDYSSQMKLTMRDLNSINSGVPFDGDCFNINLTPWTAEIIEGYHGHEGTISIACTFFGQDRIIPIFNDALRTIYVPVTFTLGIQQEGEDTIQYIHGNGALYSDSSVNVWSNYPGDYDPAITTPDETYLGIDSIGFYEYSLFLTPGSLYIDGSNFENKTYIIKFLSIDLWETKLSYYVPTSKSLLS